MIWYISGPMTGYPDDNRPAFHRAEAWLRSACSKPITKIINPASLDRHGESLTWAEYLRRDVPYVCQADALLVLPQWQVSKGACTEVLLANWLGIPVVSRKTVTLIQMDTYSPQEVISCAIGDRAEVGLNSPSAIKECKGEPKNTWVDPGNLYYEL